MRAATTHSSGTTLFTFTALKCAITPIHEVHKQASQRIWHLPRPAVHASFSAPSDTMIITPPTANRFLPLTSAVFVGPIFA